MVTGCFGGDDPVASRCPSGAICDSSEGIGPVHAKRADGSVGVSVDEAWPNRPAEAAPLDAAELAGACAALAACVPIGGGADMTDEETRHLYMALCLDASSSYFWEERAVPSSGKNERWTYEAREILASGSCAGVLSAQTDRPAPIVCEEAGCWWSSPDLPVPTVTCAGDVATLSTAGKTFTRDCARALSTCSETSPTGCADRAPVACEHPAKDRCDGDVRLGCDGAGRVSFHDCARVPGGTCGAREDGSLGCIYPSDDCGTQPTCEGDVLTTCALGESVQVDCKALGLGACVGGLCVAE